MWAQLAMSGLSALQNEQNRKRDLESNIITQKYAPWTGARADFSSQGKNNTLSTLLKGYGAGMLQDKVDKAAAADDAAQALSEKQQEWNDDAEYYSKLSANPASVGASPINQGKSTFASAFTPSSAGRTPAFEKSANSAPSSSQSDQFMGMLNSSNPWEQLTSRPLLPSELETQLPSQSSFDATSKLRSNIWSALPNNMPIKRGY